MRENSFIFYGIPKTKFYALELTRRINLERAKIYFGNALDNAISLIAGGLITLFILYTNGASSESMGMWFGLFIFSALLIYLFERHVHRTGLDFDNLYTFTFTRIVLGLSTAIIWGCSVLLLPDSSQLGHLFLFLALGALVTVGVLGFSVMPSHFLGLDLGSMVPFMGVVLYRYGVTGDMFFLTLFIITVMWQIVVLKKSFRASKASIEAIILNEQLKDEIAEHKHAKETIEHLAHHDYLTGVANRRYFESEFEKTNKENLGILLIDLDDFKPINDTFGHDIGDKLLQKVTNNIQSRLDPSDMLARIGGDEFAILSVHRTKDELIALKTSLDQALDTSYEVEGNTIENRASIGCASYGIDGQTLLELQRVADFRMYKAKQKNKH